MTEAEEGLQKELSSIQPLDRPAMEAARKRVDGLAKPPGSLGALEELAVQLAGITKAVQSEIRGKCIIILSADNGVVEEGVASTPQSVTLSQTINFTRGLTGAAVLAREFHCRLMVVDVGVNSDARLEGVLDRKIRKSTWNIAKGPAMTRQEAVRAVLTGIECAQIAVSGGANLLGAGEMGIGNTTTSSAVLSALTGASPALTVGRGSGLTDEAFSHKKEVVARALARNAPDPADPLGVLCKVGGFDIAAMAGVFLGGAKLRVPVVVDGLISVVAALAAARLSPHAAGYLIASHRSMEPGYQIAAKELGLCPLFDLGMRLGEGSGCPFSFAVLEGACAMMNRMATFEEAAIDPGYLSSLSEKRYFSGEPQEALA